MSTPALIEYLMACPSKDGGRLVGRGFQQLSLVYFPGNTSATLTVTPPTGYALAIGFDVQFGEWPAGVIDADVSQFGEKVYSGRVDQAVIANGLQHFLPITDSQPVSFFLTNRDSVAHQGQLVYHYITMMSMDRVHEAWDIIKKMKFDTSADRALVAMARCMGIEVVPDTVDPWRSS